MAWEWVVPHEVAQESAAVESAAGAAAAYVASWSLQSLQSLSAYPKVDEGSGQMDGQVPGTFWDQRSQPHEPQCRLHGDSAMVCLCGAQ